MGKKSAKLAAMPIPSAPGALSVENTLIGTLVADPVGRAAILKHSPPIEQYLDQIKDMTLRQLSPMSQGALDDATLASIQNDLDAAVSPGE